MNNVFKDIISKTIRRIDDHNIETNAASLVNRETFLPYKNLCNGERDVVVCGAGPSLKKYIPIDGAVHIAVNRAFMFEKVDFDFIFAQDMDGIRMIQEELIKYRPHNCVKFLAQTSEMNEKTIPESLAIKCNAKRFICDYYLHRNGYKSKPVLDIANEAIGGMPNVGLAVMQLALYFNPRNLYIVGCDMSGNHFTTTNQTSTQIEAQKKALEKEWDEERNALLKKWSEIKEFAEVYYPDTSIISVNPVGLRGMFRDLDQ